MTKLKRTPIEYFCYDCGLFGKSEAFESAIGQQYCKYIKSTCVKPRKSMPEVKVGICTVGATVAHSNTVKPVIICPQRFKEDIVFEAIRQKYLSNWNNVTWIPEVNIGVGGSIDYVPVELNKKGEINDFLCCEIQAAGTTGSPYPFIKDLKEYGTFNTPSKHKSFGINWANEFSKTMMQQAYQKGRIIEHWGKGRKIVFIIQDVAMEYLRSVCDFSGVYSYKDSLPIDFCSFKMIKKQRNWNLVLDNINSTDVQGISKLLGGANVDEYLSEEEFKLNIFNKGIQDGILKKEATTYSL